MGCLEQYKIHGLTLSHSVDEKPDNDRFFLHVHDDCEFFCLVTGKVGYVVEGRVYDLRPGSLMLMRSAETHRLLVRGAEPYERYTLNFRPELLTEHGFPMSLMCPFTRRGLGERNLYLPGEFHGIEPLGLFRQMCASCDALPAEPTLVANLIALLCAVNTAFSAQPKDRPQDGDEVGRELIDYINDHLTEELSLSVLSEQIHMSPSQINRVFRRLTGTSVYHYILSKRLVLAQSMIAAGESAVAASQNCGFHDYSAFYRLYKKRMGAPPIAAKQKEPMPQKSATP